MANPNSIIDADGHVLEDLAAIMDLMPAAYHTKDRNVFLNPFPPGDHLHSTNLLKLPEGSFDASVGPEAWLKFHEDIGIDISVLYPTWGVRGARINSVDWAIDVCHAYNDWLYKTYISRSPNFKGMALLPMQDPDAAAEELRRAVTELGMCGAALHPTGFSQSHLGNKRYFPIYAEADRLGCALAVHGGDHDGFGMDDLTPYAPVNALGHPIAQMIAFGALLFNGVFDKFPRVRFAFLEAGVAWLLLCIERFDGAYESHRPTDLRDRFVKLRGDERVSDYIKRKIDEGRIYVGVEGDESSLVEGVRVVGNKAFVYSSDYPHEVNTASCQKEIGELRANGKLAEGDKNAILRGNALRLYGLPG